MPEADDAGHEDSRACQDCGRDPPIMTRLETQHPDADTELHYSNAYRAARRHDPVGAVHRRAREPGHAGAVQALSRRARAREGDDRRARAADPVDRVLPREVEVAPRHGARASSSSTAARCRRRWTRSIELPGVGRKTANVVLGHALGVPGLPVDRHVLRVVEPHRHRRVGRSGSRRAAAVRGAAARRMDAHVRHADPARPPHLQAEAALRSSAPCATTATTTSA